MKTCGTGATGIDNVWYDLDSQGKPTPGGGNPIWHALNLQNGIVPSYLDAYKVTDKALVGTYVPYYSSTMVAPWLWNASKKVFLSTETSTVDRGQGPVHRQQQYRRRDDLGNGGRLCLGCHAQWRQG